MVTSYPSWVHPDVLYHEKDWRILRDTYEGERAVKQESIEYLPKMMAMEDEEYQTFLDNATYFNMTYRTVGALVGTIFRRKPVVSGISKSLRERIKKITKKNHSLLSFTQTVTRELSHMGRVGVLVDVVDGGDPYLVHYTAESIIDWNTAVVDGREKLTKVVLMEMEEVGSDETSCTRKYKPILRVLEMINGEYVQKLYKGDEDGDSFPSMEGDPDTTIHPSRRGTPLDHIPFYIFGPNSLDWKVQKSPLLDIARMNISHYRSYAQLEHGRYYTGFPVFWASKQNADVTNEYTVGPNRVWELPTGEKAGIMEFNGQGLKFLENAISAKQGHIAALGGRIVGVETQAVSESDNQSAMKDRNEQSLLLNLTMALDDGLTAVLQDWAIWSDETPEKAKEITVEFNKDFLLKEIASREFRAVHSMYTDGVLPIDVIFDYLQKAEVIPDWMEIEEFKTLLESESSFINNPDIDAKKKGFPDKKTELELNADEETGDPSEDDETARALRTAQQQGRRRIQPGK